MKSFPCFAFFCGRVVHGRTGCPVRRDSTLRAAEEKKEWGTWLRVEVRRPNFQYDGSEQARRTRTAAEDNPEESGSVGRQFALRNSSGSEKQGVIHNYVELMVGLIQISRDRVEGLRTRETLRDARRNCMSAHAWARQLLCHVLLYAKATTMFRSVCRARWLPGVREVYCRNLTWIL
jgi:hypothetical protein